MKLSKNEIEKSSEKLIDLINDYLLDKYFGHSENNQDKYLTLINPIFDNLIDRLEYDQNNRD